MKERLLTLALACGALLLFYALFVPKSAPPGTQATQPLSTERGPNGYFALREWLQNEHIPVISFRQRYDKLQQANTQGSGNLLITTMPHRLTARPLELARLKAWIRNGNTVLVMAALADTPDWAMDGQHGLHVIDGLKDLSGVEFYPLSAANEKDEKSKSQQEKSAESGKKILDAMQKLLEPQRREFAPTGSHPLMSGVKSVAAISEFPADDWQARPKQVSATLALAHLTSESRSTPAPSFWLANYGKGQIFISGFASPFVNKLIGESDNARLLSNIVAWSVTSGGAVIFDDAHQGAVAFYDPQAFFGDARLHRALGWLLLLWFIFVLGSVRLRPTQSSWNPVDILSFVRATGGFMARTLRPTEAGRRALVLFFNRIRQRLGMPEDGAPVWDWLETQGKIAAADLAELRSAQEKIASEQRIDFPALHNLLTRMAANFI